MTRHYVSPGNVSLVGGADLVHFLLERDPSMFGAAVQVLGWETAKATTSEEPDGPRELLAPLLKGDVLHRPY